MKLNKICIYSIYIISINMIISCSSMKNHANYNKDIQLDYHNKYNTQNNQKIINTNQSKIKKINIEDTIYFPLDQYDILTQFFYILDDHANFLCNYPLCQIKIEGHADERGTPEYNIALGERRANAVKLYLQSKGVLSKQISIVSYGKEKPAVFGHDEQAYSKNRRAILIYP